MFHLRHVVKEFQSGFTRLEVGKPDGGINGYLENLFRCLLGHGLDVHAPFTAQHQDGRFGLAVDDNTHIIFCGDIHSLAYKDSVYGKSFNIHSQYGFGTYSHLRFTACKFHTAGLSPASGVHLGLYHSPFHAQLLICRYRFIGREAENTVVNGQAITRKKSFCLILMNFHSLTIL